MLGLKWRKVGQKEGKATGQEAFRSNRIATRQSGSAARFWHLLGANRKVNRCADMAMLPGRCVFGLRPSILSSHCAAS